MTTNPTKITVYTKPACRQCDATKKTMDAAGLEYDVVDLTLDADALDMVIALGFGAAPVVIAGDAQWAGFQPDRIAALASQV